MPQYVSGSPTVNIGGASIGFPGTVVASSPSPQSVIPAALDEHEKSLSMLHQTITDLEQRLIQVMEPVCDAVAANMVPTPVNPQSGSVVARLRRGIDATTSADLRLRELLSRLHL